MSEEMEIVIKNQPLENFRSLQISSLEEDEDDDFEEEDDDDFDEEGDDDQDSEIVTLGFVEKPEHPNSLLRHLFPSKAGGIPAWLDPVDLPSQKSHICGICREPMQFLLQVYAPIDSKESTFHRTLFVFMCPSMACLSQDQHEQWKRRPERQSRSVKVFRCQLPRVNGFYSSEAPKKDNTDKPSSIGATLCNWCGTWKGDKVCSGCRNAHYCSEKHQTMHWRSGHKTVCQRMSISSQSSDSSTSNGRTTSSKEISEVASNTLWPEFEVISDDECEFDTEVSEDSSLPVLDFESDADKKSWVSFQQRIGKAPTQVLRYTQDVNAKPLWPMSSGCPSKADIPKCNYCDGPLRYELQILPQLLYHFGVKNDKDDLDWATIVAYTCEDSCEASVAYKEEFAWVQLSSQSAVPLYDTMMQSAVPLFANMMQPLF